MTMRLRIRYGLASGNWFQRWLISKWGGKVFYPYMLFAYAKGGVSDRLFRHELQHVYQVWRMGWFGFYARYLCLVIRHGYKNHPFEVEAHDHQYDAYTPEERKLKDES